MRLFEVITDPPFHAILVEPWKAPAHRYFLSYRIRGDFRHVMGLPVVDEFATFSSPIFFGPKAFLGQLYNVGITLGHQRSPEMSLDQGWPPLCVGLENDASPKPDWETRLLNRIKSAQMIKAEQQRSDFQTQSQKIGEVTIHATNAPLLPKQLQRLCQRGESSLTIAFATGNRITGMEGKLLTVKVVSEATLTQLLHRFSTQPVHK